MAIRANGFSEFSFINGVQRWSYGKGIPDTVYDCASNPDYATMSAFSRKAYENGTKQKIADAGAMESGTPVAEKAAAQRECARLLTELTWSGERQNQMLTVCARMFPDMSPKELIDTIDGLTEKEKRDLKKTKEYVEKLAEIMAETATETPSILAKFKKAD